tara:strand:- start:317 stop:1156 length:840 start_codon:yes stop_codon:yes gene_type:complete
MIEKFKEFLNLNNGFLGATYSFFKLKRYQIKNFKTHRFKITNDDKKIENYIKDLKKNGYCIIENFISNDECKEFIKIIDNFINDNKKLVWIDNEGSDERIMGAENVSKKFSSSEVNIFTKKIGSIFLQQKLELFMIMANKVSFKNNNIGSGGGWHKDSNAEQFKSLLYLSNVSKENGPFQIVKNSDNNLLNFKIFSKLKKKFPAYRFTEEEIKQITKKKNIVEFVANAGTLILFNTCLLHRGSPIKSGTRYAITNYFYPEKKINENKNHFNKRIIKKLF